ncbi:DcrB-related protein [Erwinia sp. AnSW2-5]|uniref:DcrB-related protein n=1 Tax=Erwinia sp. AnSW2-5 TaxID=3367692 RepID=UPI00385F85BC
MITYKIFEGDFLTDMPVIDVSVNVMRFRDPENYEYNILINRVMMTEGQTVVTFCEKQMQTMQNTLPGFKSEGKQLEHNIGPAKLPVVQVAHRYLENGNYVRQVQSYVQLPQHPDYNPGNNMLMVFTLVAEQDFTEFQRKHYVQVINSFAPKTKPIKED